MCTNPISIRQHGITGEHCINVPCGKCLECKRSYQNHWYVRMCEQLKESGKAVFFTLTYNEESIPLNVDNETGECYRTVRKKDIVDWLKRFRTRRYRAGLSTNFKYFITSEYGPRTKRPHYHGLIFGLSNFECRSLFLEWQSMYGFTSQSTITYDNSGKRSIRYVSKYCSKGVFENPLIRKGFCDSTFRLISKKLGFSYISRMRNWHLCKDLHIRKFIDSNYNPYYVRQVYNRCYYHESCNNGDNPIYRYALPRYWKNYIYSNLVPLSSTIGKENTPPKKDRLVPLRSQLQIEMSNLAFQDSCDLYNSRLNELLSSGLFCKEGEAVSYLAFQESCVLEQRRTNAYTSLAKFYDQSHI